MSFYQFFKLFYMFNCDEVVKVWFQVDVVCFVQDFVLIDEECGVVVECDIGLFYVLGVNGQILMYFVVLCGVEWFDYF